MDNLLYYPYINIPKTTWIARTLLYYDRIGSIVPQRYLHSPESFDPFMRAMVHDGLIEIINPMTVLEKPWKMTKPFIQYLESNSAKTAKRREAFRTAENVQGRISVPMIHIDKFAGEVFYQLEQAGLARRTDFEWFSVEHQTARELMTYLATVIGGKLQYQPTTDVIRVRNRFFKEKRQEYETYKTQDFKRNLVLKELIPFPQEIDLFKLRSFKEQHNELLKAFKNKVELLVLNPTIETDSPLFVEAISELKLRKSELSAKMSESKLGAIVFGTVCGMIGAFVGFAEAATPGAVGLAVPGFANAIYSALQIERADSIFDQSGMKYLALIDKKLRRPT